MAKVEQSIEVDVPVRTAYNQWTQFEEFPQFMDGIESVTQLDDTHLRWVAEIGGKRDEWQAEITEQLPDERIAWTAVEGKGTPASSRFTGSGTIAPRSWSRSTGSRADSSRSSEPGSARTSVGSRAISSGSRS